MLRKILLNKKKRELEAQLEENRKSFEELETREKEIAEAIEEVENEEEEKAVEEEVEKYEKDKLALNEEKEELESKIKDIDDELEELEKKEEAVDAPEERKEEITMNKREMFGNLTREKTIAIVEREEVKDFLTRVRELKGQNRAVTGAELLIPSTLIGILRENIHNYSKLLNMVWNRRIKGQARVSVAGTIPEAVWTEACATLNELDFGFNVIELEGYKVGGYIPICNATLEDASDIDLYNEIMYMLAQAIGLALDKAILYGTGKKMPLGIVTRLAQKAKPENYPAKAREWKDLSTTNILQVAGKTPTELYGDLIVKASAADSKYSTGRKFWAMNDKTYAMLQSKILAFNAAGALVSGVNNALPIINGEVATLPFIPDGDIIGGYSDLYVLAERAGITLAASEHVRFIEDDTVFKGTARYDGTPAIAEGFVLLNIDGKEPTTAIEFVEDKANKVATA
jgi:HK97 family phage major capsid protein|nr:MAG TPA: major capsid protein [Caudoviricetes sp.]